VDWDAWNVRSLKDEPIVRLILDGTVVRAQLDKKATSISLLVAMGVRQDGQKVLLAVKNMGGEMLFWALLASGQITMRARWTAGEASPRCLPTSPHEAVISSRGRLCQTQFQHKSRRHSASIIP
jgi:hypothetical protein